MDESVLQAAKWALVVLIAGFVGYIGRYLAMLLLKKIRKEDKKPLSIKTDADEAEKYKYKLEKKRLKSEVKKMKKQKD